MSHDPIPAAPDDRIPIVVCIDVEPDDPEPTGTTPWSGFEAAVEWIKPVRAAAAALTGTAAQFSWFLRMDSQIRAVYGSALWLADNRRTTLDALTGMGDELGIHPHAWRQVDGKGWVVDLADAAWVAQVTDESFAAYAQAFGSPCRAHRFGDGFLTDELVAQIQELGARVDLTTEPGMTLLAAARRGPQFVGTVPYSAGALRTARIERNDGAELTMIPLASVDPDAILPLWHRVGRRIRYPNQPRHRQLVLAQPFSTHGFWDLVERDIEAGELNVIAFGIRSSTFVSRDEAALVADKLHGLADHPLGRRVRFATPSEAAAYVARRTAAT